MEKENRLFDKALSLLPKVKETFVCPSEDQKYSTPLKKGDHVEIDFGKHLVGRLKIKFGYKNSHPDAPVWLKISFAENHKEFEEKWRTIMAGYARHGCSRSRCILI